MANSKRKIDIKYLGVPNVCFSLTAKVDKREKEFIKQRKERGFDDSETWSLRDTVGNFTLPRLKRFREIYSDKIVDKDGILKKIDMSIRAFELLTRNKGDFILDDAELAEYKRGMKAYGQIFLSLWW